MSHQARGGHVQRLTEDLRSTVSEATDQALRLEGLIRTNGGLWRPLALLRTQNSADKSPTVTALLIRYLASQFGS